MSARLLLRLSVNGEEHELALTPASFAPNGPTGSIVSARYACTPGTSSTVGDL